jgi:hypothetical protein
MKSPSSISGLCGLISFFVDSIDGTEYATPFLPINFFPA